MPSPSSDEVEEAGISPRQLLALVIFGVVTQMLTFYLLPLGGMHDDACYVLRAQALLEGAVNEGENYPPGWPTLLAPFLWLGLNPESLRWLAIVLATGAGCAFAALAARQLGAKEGMLVGVLFMGAPQQLRFGSSLMADPLYWAIAATILLLLSRPERLHPLAAALIGLLCGWGAVTRGEGQAMAAASLLTLLLLKRWFSLALVGGGYLVTTLLFLGLSSDKASHYHFIGERIAAMAAQPGYYLSSWLSTNLTHLSNGTLGAPLSLAPWLSTIAVLCALPGWWHWWRKSPQAACWYMPGVIAILFIFPIGNARYWLTFWPLLLIALGLSLPRQHRLKMLGVIWVLQLVGSAPTYLLAQDVAQWRSEVYHPAYQAITRATPDDALICAAYPCNVRLLSARRSHHLQGHNSLAELMANLAFHRCDWLLIERNDSRNTDYLGRKQESFLPRLGLWCQSSSLLTLKHQSELYQLYYFEANPETFSSAYEHLRQAFSASGAEQEEHLRQALELEQDLPEARVLLGVFLCNSQRFDQGIQQFEQVLSQYPHDLQLWILATKFLDQADDPRAQQWAARGLEMARALGDQAAVQQLTRLASKGSAR